MSKPKRKWGECYLCGQTGHMSMDHVPPKNLSPSSPDSDFILVTAHKSCNEQYSHEESKFRDFVVTAATGRNNPSLIAARQKMLNNFNRNYIGRAGRVHKDQLRLLRNMYYEQQYAVSGSIYLGKTLKIKPSHDTDFERLFIKIARGLHYYHGKESIPETYIMQGLLLREGEAFYQDIFDSTNIIGRCGDFFHYRGGHTPDSKTAIWYMLFYSKVQAVAWFLNREEFEKMQSESSDASQGGNRNIDTSSC